MVTVSRSTIWPPSRSREKPRITAAVKKSSATMIFLLFTLSATMPPMGDSKMAGTKAQAVTVPYRADDPVRFSRYRGSANRMVALPNRETIWPITTSVKSLENSFSFIL